jgi:hypothetical protein
MEEDFKEDLKEFKIRLKRIITALKSISEINKIRFLGNQKVKVRKKIAQSKLLIRNINLDQHH